jgi:predicted nucleic acid-binding Zn ribbon protein
LKKAPAPISEVLKSVFTQLENRKISSQEEIESLWKSLVGDAGFKHSRPASLKKSVLTVKVDSSTWMQELSMQKRQLLKGLKRDLGKDRISEIQFRIGEF